MMKACKKTQRDSNVELLRVVAMTMIIALHQVVASNALANLTGGSMNYYLTHGVESVCISAVNCFVLISGYFMIEATEAPLKKCMHLLIDVAFWGLLGIGCTFLFWREPVSVKSVILVAVPYIKGGRWFVRDYIILMLLSPFLNSCLRQLSKRSYQVLLLILLLQFSVWPSFFPNPPIDDYGYSCVHFVQLYAIAGYLRLHLKKMPKPAVCMASYWVSTLLTFISAIFGIRYAYGYNYLFAIVAAVSLFLFFRGITLRSIGINKLAASSFDVFVIHTSSFFASLIYIRLFHADLAIYGASLPYLIGLVVCPPVFYLFCATLSAAKQWVFRHSVDKWLDRLPVRSYQVD